MKKYQFTIHASPAHALGDIVMQHFTQTIYKEEINGTIEEVKDRIQAVKNDLMQKTYDKNMGFSISAIFWGGQRKPNGYDSIKRQLCANFINR